MIRSARSNVCQRREKTANPAATTPRNATMRIGDGLAASVSSGDRAVAVQHPDECGRPEDQIGPEDDRGRGPTDSDAGRLDSSRS